MQQEPVATVEEILAQDFPAALAVFLAGSVMRGEGTATSDLDVVIVLEHPAAPWRESRRAGGWPVELFIHSLESWIDFFESDVARLQPSLLTMCLEGQVLRDQGGLAGCIRATAKDMLDEGPPALSPEDVLQARYHLTDMLEDFNGVVSPEEGPFVAQALVLALAEKKLAWHRQWQGHGKWLWRVLHRCDPVWAQQLLAALQAYHRDGEKGPLLQVGQALLELMGGTLFEGYRLAGKRPMP